MDEGSRDIGVDFVINFGDAFGGLKSLDDLIGATAANAVREFQRIEQSVAGGLNLKEASAQFKALNTTVGETTRELRTAAMEAAKVERAGESLIRQLERQNATYGKNRTEVRAMRVEEAALAAERTKNTDLAIRLRTELSLLVAQEANAAQAAEAEAQALREAAHAHDIFEAAARRGMMAFRSEEAAAKAASIAAYEQQLREAAHAHDLFNARVREGAAAMALADREAAEFEAVMARVQGRVDPGAVTIGKLRTELDEARLAFDRGRIGAEAFEKEQARVAAAAGKVYGPQQQLTGSVRELGEAQRFTANETLNLYRQLGDIGTTAAMGMNPFMILVQQGPQVFDVLQQAQTRGVSAGAAFAQMGKDIVEHAVTGLGRLGPLLNPVNLLLAGTAIAAIAVVRTLASYGDAIHQFEGTVAGLGRTSGQTAEGLETIAEAAAVAGQRSIGATRDSVNAFAAAGIQGEQTLTSLASIVDKYAKLTGQDVPAAQAALASAMQDPAKAADTFTQSLGLLTGAQYEHIKQLAAQGDQEQATSELTRILSGDLAANAHQVAGLAHVMDALGNVVSGVSSMFGRLDQRIRAAGASYDAWLKQHAGGWAVDLFGTGNQAPRGPDANAGRNQDQVAALNASQSLNTSGMRQINDLLAQQRVLQKGLADTTGLTGVQVQALRHDYAAVTDTLNANRSASGAWITTQERAHLVAVAQDRLAGARTQKEKAAAQQQITRLQLGNQVLTQTERQTQAQDAYNRVADRYRKPKTDHHADTLARDVDAITAQIGNLYDLAKAYDVSGAAALLAEARVTAESKAIKQNNKEVEAAVSRQVQLVIAQRVANAAKSAAATRDEARVQTEVNAMIAAGLVPAERANELVRDRIADLPLLAAIEVAQQRGLKAEVEKATAALNAQQSARKDAKAAEIGAFYAGADQQADRQLAVQQEELKLVGATASARAEAMARLQAQQTLVAKGYELGTTYATNYIDKQGKVAAGAEINRQAQESYNASLSATAELFDTIDQSAQLAARGMADAFGRVGSAIGDAATIMTGYYADQARLQQAHAAAIKAADGDQTRIARENQLFAIRTASAQIGAYGDMAAAAKGFFKEGTTGYKAMATAEKVFRAIEFAMAVKNAAVQLGLIGGVATARATAAATSAAADATFTGTSIGNAGLRAAADGTAAMAKTAASSPFPFNLAGMAVMAAALASIGVATGFFGGGGKNTLAKANDGTGTVLGDTAAQSESLKRSMDALKEVDTLTNTYARQMAASLKSIDSQIGNVAALVVRAGDVNASTGVTEGFKSDTTGKLLSGIATGGGLFTKIPVIGGIIGAVGGLIGSLFGSKTTVIGSGLYGKDQKLSSVLAGGYDASYYSDVEKQKKFLGIKTGTSYSTKYSAADPNLETQFTLILKQFNDAIAASAAPLGVATGEVQARLNNFVVSIGKIDLKGLTGEQIQEKLTAVFGAAADKMASTAIPGIERFQKVGEGAFETLVRVASTIEAVGSSLDLLGTSARGFSIDAKLALADQFDSVSDLTSAASAYFEAFYSKEEQAAAKTAQFAKVFDSLGLAMPTSLAGFRALVDAQNLSTAAGQSTYATLLKLAPAFADLQSAMEGAKSAADIASERADLERQLLQVQGNTAALRALDLAKLDISNRELQQQIWAIQDAQEAAKAAEALRDAWTSVGDSIMDEVKRIRGLTDAANGNGFATLMGQFNAATASARAGDQEAAKSLPALSQALLTAAGEQATSRQELERVRAQTAASLEATYGVIGALAKGVAGSSSTGSGEASAAAAAAAATPTAPAANDKLVSAVEALQAEVADLRRDNNAGQAAIAGNTKAIDRKIGDVTTPNGGQAISIAMAA